MNSYVAMVDHHLVMKEIIKKVIVDSFILKWAIVDFFLQVAFVLLFAVCWLSIPMYLQHWTNSVVCLISVCVYLDENT